MNIIGHKFIFLSFSAILVIASFVALAVWGLKFGIDFTGGSLMEVEFGSRSPVSEEIKRVIEPLNLGIVTIQQAGEKGWILRFRDIDEETHVQLGAALSSLSPQKEQFIEKRFDTIGPTIGRTLRNRSLLAIALAVIGIIVYVGWAFRSVSEPVSSWKYGIVAIIALIHDISIPTGVFSVMGHWRGTEIDSLFITALLTVMGFSVHDTIVIFDRIRENLIKQKGRDPYGQIVNVSLNETMTRSINTTLTVFIVLLAIYVLGGETVKYFALALMIGIVAGTYSSIFVASPLLVIWNNFSGEGGKARRKKSK